MNKSISKEEMKKELDQYTVRADNCTRNQLVVPLEIARSLIDRLPEPEIPIVPQFVADWYESQEGPKDIGVENRIFHLCLLILQKGNHNHTGFDTWFLNPKNKAIETILKMKNGYQIEKTSWSVLDTNGTWLTSINISNKKNKYYISFTKDKDECLRFESKEEAEAINFFIGGEVREV